MNVDYQELINVILWEKSRNDITLPEFVRVCLCNLLVINNSLYALLLNSYEKQAIASHGCHEPPSDELLNSY